MFGGEEETRYGWARPCMDLGSEKEFAFSQTGLSCVM